MPASEKLQRQVVTQVQQEAATIIVAISRLAALHHAAENRGIPISQFNEAEAATAGQVVDFAAMSDLTRWAVQAIQNNDTPWRQLTAVKAP
jgi:hypothetical protein